MFDGVVSQIEDFDVRERTKEVVVDQMNRVVMQAKFDEIVQASEDVVTQGGEIVVAQVEQLEMLMAASGNCLIVIVQGCLDQLR